MNTTEIAPNAGAATDAATTTRGYVLFAGGERKRHEVTHRFESKHEPRIKARVGLRSTCLFTRLPWTSYTCADHAANHGLALERSVASALHKRSRSAVRRPVPLRQVLQNDPHSDRVVSPDLRRSSMTSWTEGHMGLLIPSDRGTSSAEATSGPTPDPRWTHFLGGLDSANQPLPMTYELLAAAADALSITPTTPEGVAGLLATSRRMWGLAWYHYELLVVSAAWSLTAVEAALRSHMQATTSTSFAKLIKRAGQTGILSSELVEKVDAGRQLRNGFAHPTRQGAWTPGLAHTVLQASHDIIAGLFPQQPVNMATHE